MRKVGQILLDMEPLLEQLVHEHELQKGELLKLISVWVDIHAPNAIEEYVDSSPLIEYYGSVAGLIKLAKSMRKKK